MTVAKPVVRIYGDPILRQKAKEINKFSGKLRNLIEDLLKALYDENGVGLAAPQIGISQKVFVIDTSTSDEPLNPIVFVNPKMVKKEGGIISNEGCLSFPGVYTDVKRYEHVVIKAKDHLNKPFTFSVSDGSLLCRAIQHEYDHLEGILFVDHCVNKEDTNAKLKEKGLPDVQEDYLLDEPEIMEAVAKKASQPTVTEEELSNK